MSTGVDVYSTTAASNGTIGGTGYFPEGQAPSTVNDAARQVMADIAAWYGQGKTPEYITGVAGTNTITGGSPSAMSAYAAGQRFILIPANTNTGAATVNITPSGASALGAKNIFSRGAACIAGELVVGVPVEIVYDGTQFNVVGPSRQIPAGVQNTTSGTTIDFTSIPTWVKTIVVQLGAVSTNGSVDIGVQLGDSGGIETSGYVGAKFDGSGTSAPTTYAACGSPGAASSLQGQITFTLQNAATNTWTWDGAFSNAAGSILYHSAGAKSTSAVLDRIRLMTSNGTDTFDAGTVNALFS